MRQRAIKKGFQQFVVLMLIFLLIYPNAIYAKRKNHGSCIKIIKLDGQVIEGELLKVKENMLVLMSSSEYGMIIPLNEIKKVKLEERGKFLTGYLIGLGISKIVGGILGERGGIGFFGGVLLIGGLLGYPMGLLSGDISTRIKIRKTYNFEHEKPETISKNLEELKSKSRF